MKQTTSIVAGVAVVALALASVLAFEASRGAFSDQTSNDSNALDAGDVVLMDNDSGAATFSVTDWVPGRANTLESCIEVSYDGSVTPADVRLYVGSGDMAGALPDYIDLDLDRGTGAAGFGNCSGFSSSESIYDGELGAFAVAHSDFATGAGTWAPSSTGETQYYRFEMTLQRDYAAEGELAAFIFTWEARNQ